MMQHLVFRDKAAHARLVEDEGEMSRLQEQLLSGKTVIYRQVVAQDWLAKIVEYLSATGRASFPNYHPVEKNCPNFHRIQRFADQRPVVRGHYQMFSFFPWNNDYFDFFARFKDIFHVRNRLAGVPGSSFQGGAPENDFAARLSFQYYPAGGGMLSEHEDPVAVHQFAVPLLLMSKKGRDFSSGGLFVRVGGEKINLDDFSEVGDLIYFHARMPHGVDPVDAHLPENWLDYRGRWIALFAVNKMTASATAAELSVQTAYS